MLRNSTREINVAPDRLAEMNLVARDWWGRDNPRLLPGECGGVTVFVMDFADGCRFYGYTGFARVRPCVGSGDETRRLHD